MAEQYAIEMLNITKRFPGIIANDNITLQLRRGEIHALLGENGAGKSTLMSVLFGLYQPEEGEIKKDGQVVQIRDPNDANALGIGMVHQHFKLVECFTVLDNIIMGVEPTKAGFLQKKEAREKVIALSEKYGLKVDPDALVEDITVGMQQRTEILKMLYRENEILIFDEPTAVLTPQEITELMQIMRNLKAEGKSILLSGCAHNGILSILDAYIEKFGQAPDFVVSGFHLMKKTEYKESEIEEIKDIAEELKKYTSRFVTCHCTGIPAYEIMKPVLGDRLEYVHSGEEIFF